MRENYPTKKARAEKPWRQFLIPFLAVVFVLGLNGAMGCGGEVEDFDDSGGLRILGTVKDGEGNPIEGAKVLLLGSGIPSVMSDSDGEFRIDNVPAGTYNIEVTKNGYKDVLEIVVVDANSQPTTSDITMEMN